MKRLIYLLLILVLAVSFAGCGKKKAENLIGVAMPTQSLQRWNQDSANMKKQLEEKVIRLICIRHIDVNVQIQPVGEYDYEGCRFSSLLPLTARPDRSPAQSGREQY